MGNMSIPVDPSDIPNLDLSIFQLLDNTIYTLSKRWVETVPSSPNSFGNSHSTYDLMWHQHKGSHDGSDSWATTRKVGNDWLFNQVIPGPNGKLYAVKDNGDLLWYHHMGNVSGTFRWAGPLDIGVGWHVHGFNPRPRDFLGIFCDTRNGERHQTTLHRPPGAIIYGVRRDGTLDWYRHDGVSDGTKSWANGWVPKTVGTDWVGLRVFSGCNGVIYLIGMDGTLSWYRHKGYLDGTWDWEGPNKVGNSWNNFRNVFSIGGGIIYAIDEDGTLWWYKHTGYQNGTDDWEERKKVDDGWHWQDTSVVCNSVSLVYGILK